MNDVELATHPPALDSPEAFAGLVREYSDMVYSSARRQLGDSAMADDVTQAVFILLWRKRGSVHGSVAGWLVKTTHFVCRDARKLCARRQFHERSAASMKSEKSQLDPVPVWESYAHVLDEAMANLPGKDRDAVALRYLRGLSYRQVGQAIGIAEDAAKKRVARAIGRLRELMSGKALVPSVAILAAHMESYCIEPAPHALLHAISAAPANHAPVANALVRAATVRSAWLATKFAAPLLMLIAAGGAVFHFERQAALPTVIAANAPANPGSAPLPAGDQSGSITLKIRAVIDGSDVLTITSEGCVWTHNSFQAPRQIAVNGFDIDTHATATLEDVGLADANLATAKVVDRSGRGSVAMQKIDGGIEIHFTDPQSGDSAYSIDIAFDPKPSTPQAAATRPTTLPVDQMITLDLKARIDGVDELHITPDGAHWEHKAIGFPTNLSINDQPWDVQLRPDLDNIGLSGADLSSATVLSRTGRDTLVMEKSDDGITIYFGDAIGGDDAYEIKIGFLRAK